MVHRSARPHKLSQKYTPSNYILVSEEGEPTDFQQVCEDEHNKEWTKAMEEEMNSLRKNRTWELVELPKERRALQNKWVYKIKHESEGKR